MRYGFKVAVIAVLLVVSDPVKAQDTFANAYSAVKKSAKRCQKAWLEGSRKSALDDIEVQIRRMIIFMNPLSEEHGVALDLARMELVSCASLIYPDGDFLQR